MPAWGIAESASTGRPRFQLESDGEAGAGRYLNRLIRLEVSSRLPPMACTSA